jgi:hypothetical protein
VTYFDTGYLAKCYVEESGSEQVRALAAERERIACSVYGRMELHAALHRKLREELLSRDRFEIVVRQLDLDEEQGLWNWLPLTDAIISAVAASYRRLPASVFVRTGDMIHLLTAQNQAMTEIFSGDIHMLAAAPHFGLVGRNVITAPR